MRQTRVIKVMAVFLAIVLPIIGSAICFYPRGTLTHEFLMAIFSGVFSVELGLVVVNLYLKRVEKKDAVQQLFRYVHEAIAEVDDYILEAGIRIHGKRGWADLIETYLENNVFHYAVFSNLTKINTRVAEANISKVILQGSTEVFSITDIVTTNC